MRNDQKYQNHGSRQWYNASAMVNTIREQYSTEQFPIITQCPTWFEISGVPEYATRFFMNLEFIIYCSL